MAGYLYAELGVVGVAMAVAYAAIQFGLKRFGNEIVTKVQLTPSVERAIFDAQVAAIQTESIHAKFGHMRGQMADLHEWHKPEGGQQDWKGASIREAQNMTNDLLREIKGSIDDLAKAIREERG